VSPYFVLTTVIYTLWYFGIMKCNSVHSKIEYRFRQCESAFQFANEQSESNTDCNLHPSIVYLASGRTYHKNVCISTEAGNTCLCGGRKKSPRTSFLVQLSLPAGFS